MPRKKTHRPLDVLINGRLVGRLKKASTGAISFQYDDQWLAWEHRFAVSLSLPLTPAAYRGAEVAAVFDNLLPDRDTVRRRVAERMGAQGTGARPSSNDSFDERPIAGAHVKTCHVAVSSVDLWRIAARKSDA